MGLVGAVPLFYEQLFGKKIGDAPARAGAEKSVLFVQIERQTERTQLPEMILVKSRHPLKLICDTPNSTVLYQGVRFEPTKL